MSRISCSEVAARLARKKSPLVAVLDSGLDAFVSLPPGTRVVGARSFVGGHAFADATGRGTACARAVAEALAGRWSEDGRTEPMLLVAQVADERGVRVDAVAEAVAWARLHGADAIVVSWADADPAHTAGLARRLAHEGVQLIDIAAAEALVPLAVAA